MTLPSSAPRAVTELLEELRSEGFEVVAVRGSGDFGWITEVRHVSCEVRIRADRGQWWIELGGGQLGAWFDSAVWEACLDDIPVEMEPVELERQAEFALRRWREVDAALTRGDIRECLSRTQSFRARTRLGVPMSEEA